MVEASPSTNLDHHKSRVGNREAEGRAVCDSACQWAGLEVPSEMGDPNERLSWLFYENRNVIHDRTADPSVVAARLV
jgi:hypothetical protein